MAPVKLEMGLFPSIDQAVSKCWDGLVLGTASPHARNTSDQLLWHLHGGSSPPLYWFSVQKQCSELLLPPPATYRCAIQQDVSAAEITNTMHKFAPLIYSYMLAPTCFGRLLPKHIGANPGGAKISLHDLIF
jgi:hypothetical protein